MADKLTPAQHRRLIHERYRDVIEARERDTLLQALHLSQSIRELHPQQQVVLDHLLRVFSDMPKLRSEQSIMTALRVRMEV